MSLKNLLLFLVPVVVLVLVFCPLGKCDVNDEYLVLTETTHYEDLAAKAVSNALQCQGSKCDEFKDFLNRNRKKRATTDHSQWILPMYDAWGKLPSGILTGNVVDYGQFDECLSIGTDYRPNTADVKGQYCGFALKANISGLVINWAVCIPDFAKLPESHLVIIDDVVSFDITGAMCQTAEYNKFEWDDWTAVACFGVIFIIIFLSTIYDGVLNYTNNTSSRNACQTLILSFSLLTNSKKLFAVSNAPGQIPCLHGIRAISMLWIVAGHRFVSQSALPTINFVQMTEFKNDIASSYISSGRAAVDTFFLFSAFLVSYIYFKGVRNAIANAEAKGSKHVENPLTWAKIPMYYIHRILRIMPALAAVFFMQITLFRRIGAGPLWPFLIEMTMEVCTKWWWSLFLFVQNYVNYKEMCIVPTWYLSADMQLYLLSPFLIIPLGNLVIKGKKKMAYIILGVVIVLSILVPMTVDFFREFDILNIYETHQRISVYTIGILFGMIMIDCADKKIKISHFLNIFLWGAALGAMIAIIATMHDTEFFPTLVKNNLYFTFTRPVWSAAVCWVVFACQFGYGGPANWLLSKSVFQVMTKLSFSMYLLHNLMITLSMGTVKVPGHFSEYEVMYNWCGDYIFTVVMSIGFVLCFESPIVGIEKVIFGTGKRPTAAPAPKVLEVIVEKGVASTSKSTD